MSEKVYFYFSLASVNGTYTPHIVNYSSLFGNIDHSQPYILYFMIKEVEKNVY